MWDPAMYQRYGDERSRPFFDLVTRVGAERPRAVVDLGCGPGDLTATLAARWPDAAVSGLDSSAEMVATAVASGAPVDFRVADVRDWSPGPDVDVVVSNAVLQWVPGHERLLTEWARRLPDGGWLAIQVPGNFDAPSHQALRALASTDRWRAALADTALIREVASAASYARLLADAGCGVDAWETTYLHVLPADGSGDHPVLRWMDGTALRPVRAVLTDTEWGDFRVALAQRLAEEYPIEGAVVYFPFRRIFVVAQRR